MAMRNVQTAYGTVTGVCGNIQSVTVFKGIPYAKPPVGELRFRPPQPPEPWEGERACDHFAPISIQEHAPLGSDFAKFFAKEFYPVQHEMSEDSLYLNIWTPAKSADEKLPVMFWIHGGGLSSGYGHEMEFDGEALAKRGVILVTLNYRLGYFGFFAHPELSAKSATGVSGNNTLLDILQALHWVQENIAAFGGDPGNVTVFGQSGGAAATCCMLTSPLADGLFHKAIIQSGVSGVDLIPIPVADLHYAEQWGESVCRILGLSLDELMALPAAELLEKFGYAAANGAGEKPLETTDGYVLPIPTREAAGSGRFRDIPIMTGGCNGDGGALSMLRGVMPAEEAAAFALLGDERGRLLEAFPPEKHSELYARLTRGCPWMDAVTFGEAQARNGRKQPYVYYFDAWIPGGDEFNFVGEGTAYHSSELWFTFGTLNRCWRRFDGRYYELSDLMMDYWTNFAKTGDPNGENLPKWSAYDPEEKAMMHFSEKQSVCESLVDETMAPVLKLVMDCDAEHNHRKPK